MQHTAYRLDWHRECSLMSEGMIVPTVKLKEFLDGKYVKHSVLSHSTACTAQEIASLAHIRGRRLR